MKETMSIMKYNRCIFNLIVGFKVVECAIVPYIAGGNYATYSRYPHSVLLDFNCESRFICGGSILNQKILLTAAHCTDGCHTGKEKSSDFIVRYGHEDIKQMKRTFVLQYVHHEDYDELLVNNDVCLMMTEHKIALSEYVKRVIIMKYPPKAKVASVAGWGVDENNELTNMLRYTKTQIQTEKVCATMGDLHPGVFCTAPTTGLGAADEGDSGSALVIDEYIQVGLVSYKLAKQTLVAYTNVSYYLNWIQKQAARLYCS